MGSFQTITPKYIVRASFEIEGVVEKSDVIGALFGQTEGLFGPELDLNELQKSGRIGRIEINLKSKKNKTNGVINIPSNLDKPLTALIASAVENVDRVGPCIAKVTIDKIEDVREQRRNMIIKRAKEILHQWTIEVSSTTEQVASEIAESIRPAEVVTFGPEKLPAGPDISKAPSIIIVEGRADVAVLLKSGIRNVIAVEGTSIPETIIKLCEKKEITVFLDGDRGGDMILNGLLQVVKIDFIARAPRGKEVEALTSKEVLRILREKKPVKQIKESKKKSLVKMPEVIRSLSSKLKETLEAVILNEKMESIEKISVSELCNKLQKIEGAHTIVFDGVITQRLIDIAEDKGVKCIIGERLSKVVKRSKDIQLLTLKDVLDKKTVNFQFS